MPGRQPKARQNPTRGDGGPSTFSGHSRHARPAGRSTRTPTGRRSTDGGRVCAAAHGVEAAQSARCHAPPAPLELDRGPARCHPRPSTLDPAHPPTAENHLDGGRSPPADRARARTRTRARPPPPPWGVPVGYGLVPIPVRLGCSEGVVAGDRARARCPQLPVGIPVCFPGVCVWCWPVPRCLACLGLGLLPPSLSLSWVALRPGGSRFTACARADWAPSPPS